MWIIELSNDSFYNRDTSTSIQSVRLSSPFKIGPNPLTSGEKLNMSLPDGEKGDFTMYDIIGRPVSSFVVDGSRSVNIRLFEGIYFWRIILEDGLVEEGKLIIH